MDKKVSTATIVRTVCLALALANQLLSAGGHSVIPIDNETVNQLVTAGGDHRDGHRELVVQ